MRILAALSLASALALASPLGAATGKSHRDLRLESEAAYNRKDYPAARIAIAAALELRPDSPRYLHNLAALSSLTGDQPAALAALRRLAALGVSMPVANDPDFASLQGTPAFAAIVSRLAENRAPQGKAEVWAELPSHRGIIEGIAFRSRTHELFLGDVHERCIWKRDRDGHLTRYSTTDEKLLGVFGLAVDEERRMLWAATSALPEMSGFAKELAGHAALAEFNLVTGELRRTFPVPGDGRNHVFGDLTVAPDGTVYVSDSAAPIIWRLEPGAKALEKLIESPAFLSLQGIVVVERTLFVTDYANGLFAIDLVNGETSPAQIRQLAPPPNTTLLGLDGLVVAPDGLCAVQNGIEPQRLVHIVFSPDRKSVVRLDVLAAGLPNFTDLTLLALVNDRPTVIAGAGWDAFDPAKAPHPTTRTVRLFQAAIPAATP